MLAAASSSCFVNINHDKTNVRALSNEDTCIK